MFNVAASCPGRFEGDVRTFAILFRVGLLTWALTAPAALRADVATDGTLGRRTRLAGPHVEIGADLGRIRGKNLFHSFERFNVETGGSATFTGPAGLENVIGRVTGGEASSIDGTLRSTIGGADLWLLNPAGILFGPNASLDLKGSFHASTADELRFADGAVFSALDSGGSSLSVAPPEAFGFLGHRPGSLSMRGSVLTVLNGEALSLVGGEIDLSAAQLNVPAGQVTLAALGGPGVVNIRSGQAIGPAADISLSAGSLVSAAAEGGGTVWVHGGFVQLREAARIFNGTSNRGASSGIAIEADTLLIDGNATIINNSIGDGQPGPISVRAGDVTLQNNGSIVGTTLAGGRGANITLQAERLTLAVGLILSNAAENSTATAQAGNIDIRVRELTSADSIISSSTTTGQGSAGNVTVMADRLSIFGIGGIASVTSGTGNAGTIDIKAGGLVIVGNLDSRFVTGVTAQANSGSRGNAGTIKVEADEVEIRNGGQIGSGTVGDGNAGLVSVAADKLEIRSGGVVSSTTGGDGRKGQGGMVTVRAGRLLISGDGVLLPTGILGQTETGSLGGAGSIIISADDLQIRNGGIISSTTASPGKGGTVTIQAGRLFISDDDAVLATGIVAAAGTGAVDGPTITGNAGTVTVRADEIEIRNGGAIASSTFTTGDAGMVRIEAGRLYISGDGSADGTGISAQAITGSGNAGSVIVRADEIEIRNGGVIVSSTGTEGDAGEVMVEAERLLVSRDGTNDFTGISSQANTGSTGPAGAVSVSADKLEIRNDGEIGSSSRGAGPAGDVRLEAGTLRVDDAGIRTAGTGAEGGRIRVVVDDLIHLTDAEVTSSGIEPAAGASIITLQADTIVLNDSAVTSLTGSGQPLTGSGEASLLGDVTVISDDSLVAASSSVVTTGVQTDIGTGLQLAPGAFVDIGRLLRESCAARAAQGRSSFTRVGRGALPPSPDRPLPAGTAAQEARNAMLPASADQNLCGGLG